MLFPQHIQSVVFAAEWSSIFKSEIIFLNHISMYTQVMGLVKYTYYIDLIWLKTCFPWWVYCSYYKVVLLDARFYTYTKLMHHTECKFVNNSWIPTQYIHAEWYTFQKNVF